MPTYNYKCKNEDCNHEFQAVHKMNDPKPPCPECSTEEPPQRIIKKTTFVLKGSGWFNSGGY